MIKPLIRKKDKRGFMGVVVFIIMLLVILIIGFIAAIGTSLFNLAGDEITPALKDIGLVDDVNISEVVEYTVVPANNFVQSLTWLVGFSYFAMIIFSIVFVITYESNPHPVFMGAFFFLVILLIFGAMVISNVYEDIYTGTDDLADRLKEQTTLSHMILYSPAILALIAFITGIFIYARPKGVGI